MNIVAVTVPALLTTKFNCPVWLITTGLNTTESFGPSVTVVPAALGLPPAFAVRDLLTGTDYRWRIGRNYVRLDPGQSHVLHVGAVTA